MAILQKSVLETIVIRFAESGQIQGIAAVNKVGVVDDTTGAWVGATADSPAREITAADLSAAAIDPALAAQQATITAQTAQIATLTQQLTDADAAKEAAQADAAGKAQTIEQLQAQIAALTAPPSDAATILLDKLNTIFAGFPAEVQGGFAAEYATVRVLIQAGQPALAAAVVQGVAVPDALADAKAQILALLNA